MVFINNLLHLLSHLMRQVDQLLFYILLLAFRGVQSNGFISVVLSPSPAYKLFLAFLLHRQYSLLEFYEF